MDSGEVLGSKECIEGRVGLGSEDCFVSGERFGLVEYLIHISGYKRKFKIILRLTKRGYQGLIMISTILKF